MDASRLMERVLACSTDAEGIKDRFGDNDELYLICLTDFLSEPNHGALREAMARADYPRAFDAAHALKGISGNLGLTGYYTAICVLVESLRAENYANVDAEFAETERRFKETRALMDENAPLPTVEKVIPGGEIAPPTEEKIPSGGEIAPPTEEKVLSGGEIAPLAKESTPSGGEAFPQMGEKATIGGETFLPTEEKAIPGGETFPLMGENVPSGGETFLPTAKKALPHAEEKAPSGGAVFAAAPKKRRKRKRPDLFIVTSAALLAGIIFALLFMFNRLANDYEDNVTTESASHLAEINYQIRQSVEDNIESDWRLAHTVSEFVSEIEQSHGEDYLFSLLKSLRETWGVSDIAICAQSGANICMDGDSESKDTALERAVRARENGQYMTIVDSDITFTVPVDTVFTYNGSPIVTLSVVKDMKSFLDDMEFSSFGNAAYMYLTDDTGKVFSRLTSPSATEVFNISALLTEDMFSAITGEKVPADSVLTSDSPIVLMSGGNYIVASPVVTRENDFRLIYFVPVSAVNATMKTFTSGITGTSLAVLLIFAACALTIILYQYRVKKKQFDSALIVREHMFDLLVKNSPTAFCMFRLGEKAPLYISGNCKQITDTASPVLTYENGRFLVTCAPGEKVPDELNAALDTWDGAKSFRSGFIRNPAADPPKYFETRLFPVDTSPGEYVCVIEDVTLLQYRETEIRTALRLSEQGSEAKTRFLSNMSHDIRTPMNAIVNMSNFAIEDVENPEKLRQYLSVIRESSGHLLMLINDILEMSRIESGRTEITSAPFSLDAELSRLCAIIQPLCDEKMQTFIHNFGGLETKFVIGDKLKVSQILLNILSNAVKFTPSHGAVRFDVRDIPSLRDSFACIRFVIEDTGMGMSKEFMEHMFEPFLRGDEKRVSGITGTGLGLSICHSYVTAMGGHIRCESEIGDGSAFTVDLYFEKCDSAPEIALETGENDDAPFNGMRCLLCEDNPTNRQIAVSILGKLGFSVDTARDGQEGFSKFAKTRQGYYDVIYMDIQMPIMDGYEAAVAIRACRHPDAARVPIIAMTANVFMEDVEKAHIAGMDGHVGKPITTAAIKNETAAALDRKGRNIG